MNVALTYTSGEWSGYLVVDKETSAWMRATLLSSPPTFRLNWDTGPWLQITSKGTFCSMKRLVLLLQNLGGTCVVNVWVVNISVVC